MDPRPRVAFDLETHLFRAGYMAPRPVCVSTATEIATGLYLADEGVRELAPLFEAAAERRALLIGHNVAFDLACLLEHYQPQIGALIWRSLEAGGIHCTQIRERLIDIERGSRWEERADGEGATRKEYNLGALAKNRCGIMLDKGSVWRTDYARLEGVPIEQWPAEAVAYARDDARATLAVWEAQEEAVSRLGYRAWTDESGRQTAFAFALHLTGCRGLTVDPPRVQAFRAELQPKMLEARATMAAHGLLHPVKGSKNMKEIRAAVEATWIGEGPIPRTPKGATKTAADVVEQCDHEGLAAFSTFAHLEKLSSSFLLKLEAAGAEPIHAHYEPLGADSGRTSCRAPNIQQQPREPGIRECFVARPGFVFIACDFDAAEVRSFAQVLKALLNRSRLADLYAKDPDFDPHSAFAAAMLKISYAEALVRKKAKDPEFKNWRQRSKSAIFGFPGGMGAKKMRLFAKGYGLNLSLKEAEDLRARYFEFEPFARDYFGLITNRIDTGLTRIEQLYSGRLRGDCGFCDGCNTYFQGLTADAAKNALWEVVRRCYGAPGTEGSPLFGCRPVAFLHDEIMIEAPEAYAHEAAVEIDRVMCEAAQELTPDVPARASPALMRHWSKGADAAYDKHGRYICFEDRAKEQAQ